MTAESLEHLFIFIGITATWLFPLWLYFHWLIDDDDKMLVDYIIAITCSVVYFTSISHHFKFTVSVTI